MKSQTITSMSSLLEVSIYIQDAYHLVFGTLPTLTTDNPCIIIDGRFAFGCTKQGFFADQRVPGYLMICNSRSLEECLRKLFNHMYELRIQRAMDDLRFKEHQRRLEHFEPWEYINLKPLE